MKLRFRPFVTAFLSLIFVLCLGAGVSAEQMYANEEAAEEDVSTGISLFSAEPSFIPPTDGNLIVVLDPGHGPSDSGAGTTSTTYESIANLAVCKYCKSYLENHYSNVTVYLTHYDNNGKKLELSTRASIAANYGADLVMSLHFNATAGGSGCEVYVSRLEEYALTELGHNIVTNLNGLGISIRGGGDKGVKTRASQTKTYWIDGIRLADYYGIIKHPATHDIPSLIIEHCFIDNQTEYDKYMSTEAKLKALGEADAKAIAKTFNLGESISSTTLQNAKYTAINEITDCYNNLGLDKFSAAQQLYLKNLFNNSVDRINLATGTGKINLTKTRTILTMENYPKGGTFTDVPKNAWFKTAVDYCVEKGLFVGTSANTFSPALNIDRGQFVTVVGRISNVSSATPAETGFSDVGPKKYYAPYVKWAAENGIVAGTGNNKYEPESPIHREDLVRILYCYSQFCGVTIPSSTGKTLGSFKDGATVDHWAKDAMEWAVGAGIINGTEKGYLNPRGNATRAEVAQIIMCYHKLIQP